jgi:Holliday junction resolvase RusA-like endonuclease
MTDRTFAFAFRVEGEPIPKGRPRFTVGRKKDGSSFVRAVTPQRTQDAEEAIRWSFRSAYAGISPHPLPGEIRLVIHFASKKKLAPTYAPDLDNLAKTVKDALNGFAWEDDCQVAEMHLTIERGVTDPYTQISWEEKA